jgi:hypothetical protein
MPHLVQMEKKYSKKGMTLVAPEVQGSTPEAIAEMAKARKLPYSITKSISGPSLSNGIPHMAVFDTKGKLIFTGHPMSPDAEKAIKTALKDVKEDKDSSDGGSIFDRPSSKPTNLVEKRSWTNSEGKTITATLISLDADIGHFEFPNGKKFDYDITKLSAEDQEVIKAAAAAGEGDEEEEEEEE